MATPAEGFVPVRFSTNELPVKERIPFWREVLGRSVTNLDLEPIGDEPFGCHATSLWLPEVAVCTGFNSAYSTKRTRELIAADTSDDLFLVVATAPFHAAQRDKEAIAADGGAVGVRGSDHGMVNFHATGHILSLRITARALAPMLSSLDDAVLSAIPRDSEPIRLLLGYVDLLTQGPAITTPEIARMAANHIHDLAAMALGATGDAAEIARGRGIRAARMRAIKADIAENLAADVRVAALAARLCVSPRYIHRLFELEGTTLSRFVLGQRLARAHRLLHDLRYGDLTIGAIAYRAGFNDLSTFNREFRRQYGATPSDVRAAARS